MDSHRVHRGGKQAGKIRLRHQWICLKPVRFGNFISKLNFTSIQAILTFLHASLYFVEMVKQAEASGNLDLHAA